MFYTYFCKCGKEKEVSHSIKEDPEILCECGLKMSRKIFGGCATHLKGFGWASKGTATAQLKPTHSTEVGVAVDYDKRQAMKDAGEKVD
jgi:predicted nucleic acid-binding Zn ribbon protein